MIILGDFNVEVNNNHMKFFCENYGLKYTIKQPTCYKNPSNLTCLDVMLTNVSRSFRPIALLMFREVFKVHVKQGSLIFI